MARAKTQPGARPPQGVRQAGGAAPAGAVTPPVQTPAPTPEVTPPPTEGTQPDNAAPGEPIAGAVTQPAPAPVATPEVTPPPTEGTQPDNAAPGEPIAGFAAPADDAVDIHAVQPGDVLRIVAVPPEGFRRCGRFWSSTEPTTVPVAELTDDQVERLLTEPQLSVSVITQAEE